MSIPAWAMVAFVVFVVLLALRSTVAELTWNRAPRPYSALRAFDGAAVVVGLGLAVLLVAHVDSVLSK